MSNEVHERQYEKLDKWDVILSLSGGTISAMMDVFFSKDISLENAHAWGKKEVDKFVLSVAKKNGYKGNDLAGAIKKLEGAYPIAADQLTNNFGGGSAHHLRDFSHHPTVTGLLFSILTQFTGKGYGTDVHGNFVPIDLPDASNLGVSFVDKIYLGVVTWVFHMISDIAGSSSTVAMGKEGTGLPGPLMSFFKEVSAIPGIKQLAGRSKDEHYNFSVQCSKLFNGTLLGEHDENGKIIKDGALKFDLRTEIGIAHEATLNKQYIPVLMNEVVVRGFYSIRRMCEEIRDNRISEITEITLIDVKKVLPFNDRRLTHMLAISSAMFSVTDISGAAIKAAIKNQNNKAGFALDLFQGINYFGVGRLALSATGELTIAGREVQKKLVKAADSELAKISSKALAVAKIGTPIGFISASIGVYQEISDALGELDIATEERVLIEKGCRESIEIIKEYQIEMHNMIEEYFARHIEIFNSGLDIMNQAVLSNDVDSFIAGNNIIQNFLGYDVQFRNQEEFDALMLSGDSLKL